MRLLFARQLKRDTGCGARDARRRCRRILALNSRISTGTLSCRSDRQKCGELEERSAARGTASSSEPPVFAARSLAAQSFRKFAHVVAS